MPDDEQQDTQDDAAADRHDTADEATSEDPAAEPPGEQVGGEQPQEGKKGDEFDAKRAQEKIRKANSEAANLRKRIKELEPLAQKAKAAEEANKSEAERLQGQLDEAEKRVAQMRARAVKSEVHALAAATFADPTDAEALLDLPSYVDESGEIDTDQIRADLADLLERKPHLGKPAAEPERRRPAPDRTQASSANQSRTFDPGDVFAGFVKQRLKGR